MVKTLWWQGFQPKKTHIKKMEVIPKVSREGKPPPKLLFSIVKNTHFKSSNNRQSLCSVLTVF